MIDTTIRLTNHSTRRAAARVGAQVSSTVRWPCSLQPSATSDLLLASPNTCLMRTLSCPKCGTAVQVAAGQKPVCPACGHGSASSPSSPQPPSHQETHVGSQQIPVNKNAPAQTKTCPYCAETILAAARKCKHCSEILDSSLKPKGKAIFKASGAFIGLAGSYHIMDAAGRILAKLKPGEAFECAVPERTTMRVKRFGAFGAPKTVECRPHEVNRFSLTVSQTGMATVVSRVDVIDSDR